MPLLVKRAYEHGSKADGERLLVDRFWPRGMTKEKLTIVRWAREVAPSEGLCKWYGHEPSRWKEFRRRYYTELEGKAEAWRPILKAAQEGTVTLVFGARDAEHNQAVALKEYLESKMAASH